MNDHHDASAYGSHIAADYDSIYEGTADTDGAVATLAALAEGGPVLELGIGTGRLALPLAAEGLEVHGVDGSAEMLDQLRAKPGGAAIATAVGDFADITMPAVYPLVVLALNTVFALPDQDAQVRCFANAARHLAPGGRFVVEAWLPEPGLPAGRSLRPRPLAAGLVGLVVAEHDPVRQVLSTTQVALGGTVGVRVWPVVHRYAWPSELDLMARLAGLTLEARWEDWRRRPVAATSTTHVSVYRAAS